MICFQFPCAKAGTVQLKPAGSNPIQLDGRAEIRIDDNTGWEGSEIEWAMGGREFYDPSKWPLLLISPVGHNLLLGQKKSHSLVRRLLGSLAGV